ncbi:MAG: glucokinase [Acidobacteriota bacterium]
MQILSGDIGGTNIRLAILSPRAGGGFDTLHSTKVRNRDYASLEDAVADFLTAESIDVQDCPLAGFGIAGPVIDGVCEGTNFPWKVDTRSVQQRLGFEHVELLNDLEALGYGLAVLDDAELETLHGGTPRPGNAAVIAAGTGLGQTGLFFDGADYHPFATEGGHTNFGPRNDLEEALLRFVRDDRLGGGRVSWERLVSGMGVVNLYAFLLDFRRAEPCAELRDVLSHQPSHADPAAAIARAADDGRCPIADEALELFAELYGAEAGNLALKLMAVSGVYLGGGIAPKMLNRLRGPRFHDAFCDKGRMRPVLEAIPVRVVLDSERAALVGAGRRTLQSRWNVRRLDAIRS